MYLVKSRGKDSHLVKIIENLFLPQGEGATTALRLGDHSFRSKEKTRLLRKKIPAGCGSIPPPVRSRSRPLPVWPRQNLELPSVSIRALLRNRDPRRLLSVLFSTLVVNTQLWATAQFDLVGALRLRRSSPRRGLIDLGYSANLHSLLSVRSCSIVCKFTCSVTSPRGSHAHLDLEYRAQVMALHNSLPDRFSPPTTSKRSFS